jgi:seryl-tRNA synthetase
MNEKLKRFDERTGIAKIEENGEEWFVVYAYLFTEFFSDYKSGRELGQVIGKGKTNEAAMIDAIVNLTKQLVRTSNSFKEIEEKIKELTCNLPCNRIEEPILPLKLETTRWNEEKGYHEFVETDTIVNADIGLDEKGNPFAYIS